MRGRSSAIDTPLGVVGHWTGPRSAGVAQLDAQRTGVTGWMVSGRVSLTGWPVDGCRWCGQAGLQMQARRQYDVACGCLCQPGSSHTRGRAWCGSGSLQPSSRQVVGPVLWSGPQRCHWTKWPGELPDANASPARQGARSYTSPAARVCWWELGVGEAVALGGRPAHGVTSCPKTVCLLRYSAINTLPVPGRVSERTTT